jgi:hypothetical protein
MTPKSPLDAVRFTVYTPQGFLTWNDERGGIDTTPRLEDAATFTAPQARGLISHKSVNGCVVTIDGQALTLRQLDRLCNGR